MTGESDQTNTQADHNRESGEVDLSGSRLVIALLSLRGVGRVVTNKLIQLAPSLAEIRRYPREQIGHRLAGLPNGAEIVSLLFDDIAMAAAASAADEVMRQHREKRVEVITPLSDAYPPRLSNVEERDRPAVLYLYGNAGALADRSVAFFGRPPLTDEVFDRCQRLVERLADDDTTTVLAGESGFCVALAKRVLSRGGRTIIVLACGLNAVAKDIRHTASLAARNHGTIVTPFPLGHGPFTHDRGEASRLMASLSVATVLANAEPSRDDLAAAAWAGANHRGVFTFSDISDIPTAHRLAGPVDDEWLLSVGRQQ